MLATRGATLPDAGHEPLYLRHPDATELTRPKSVLHYQGGPMIHASRNPEISILPAHRDDLPAIMLLERSGFPPQNSGASAAGAANCSAKAGRS